MVEVSKSEWEVMRVIWTNGSVTSSQVISALKDKQGWADSTVKTLLGRLQTKGVIVSHRQGRAFIYQSLVSEQTLLEEQLDSLLERVCQKNQSVLARYLLKKIPLTNISWSDLDKVLKQRQTDVMATIPCNCVQGQCRCSSHCEEGICDGKAL